MTISSNDSPFNSPPLTGQRRVFGYYRSSPTRQGWIKTIFVTRQHGYPVYYLSMTDEVIPTVKVDADINNRSLRLLAVEEPIERGQSVWIAPDQCVYIADAVRPVPGERLIDQDDLTSIYDSIDQAVMRNLKAQGPNLDPFFVEGQWKILISVLVKYITNGQLNEKNFGNISYVFIPLEKRYKLRFNRYLAEYQMSINLGQLLWLRDGRYNTFPLSIRDIRADYVLETENYSLEDFARQLTSTIS